MSQLTVYKASAGSGKTYKLTEEYLSLLFANSKNYMHILALTFTNKAAGEMKGRIIDALSKLANDEESSYRALLASKFSLSYSEIKDRAATLLLNILHDFSRFSISTIDSFFQRVFRVFIRELRLQIGYNIEFDTDKVLMEAIDRLFFDLHENKTMREWLAEFALQNIEEGRSWNLNKGIFELGKEVFKEEFTLFDSKYMTLLADKSFMAEYVGNLYKYKNELEQKLTQIGLEARQNIADQSLTIEDFSHKNSGIAGYFYKLAEKKFSIAGPRILEGIDNAGKWYNKNAEKKSEIEQLVNNLLNEKLKTAIRHIELLETTNRVLANIYTLGILTDLSSRIRESSHEYGRFVLNDITNLLHSIIGENESPFIYEKLGTYYSHIMMDEFQDTSKVQWMNLKPLVENVMAENNKALVIGDIKQSIYRWRNSDWTIMAEGLENDFKKQGLHHEKLTHNWRSKANIIRFNNVLFKNAAILLQQDFNKELYLSGITDSKHSLSHNIQNSYLDVMQEIPADKDTDGGYIEIARINGKETKDILEKIPLFIERLQDRDYKAGDIAILVRSKIEGKEVADYLLQYKLTQGNTNRYNYNFISNESLFLGESNAIQLIVGIIRYIYSPEDRPNLALIKYLSTLMMDKLPEEKNEWHALFALPEEIPEDILEPLLHSRLAFLKSFSAYELTEFLIQTLGLNCKTDELPFLETFLDRIYSLALEERASLHYILEWWEDKGKTEAVQFSGLQDAIQIITIHKSKGLEFKAVIIPFCHWDLDNKRNIIWCQPVISPFNQLPLVPLRYSSKLGYTLFAGDYFEEKNKAYIDNINLLYVAFTRAREALFIMLPLPDSGGKKKTVAHLVRDSIQWKEENDSAGSVSLALCNLWMEETGIFEMGKISSPEREEPSENYYTYELISHISTNIKNKLTLRYSSKDYLPEKKDLFTDKINYGSIMHELFAHITTCDDIDRVLKTFIMEGKLSRQEAEDISHRTLQMFRNKQVKNWFSTEWRVKTEAGIMTKGGIIRRPDRVIMGNDSTLVIDYKFGQTEQSSHLRQVKEYMQYIESMGHINVKGYVWYVDQNVVVECGI